MDSLLDPEKFKGFRFYYLNHSTRIVESGNAHFIENVEVNARSSDQCNSDLEEITEQVTVPLSVILKVVIPTVVSKIIILTVPEQPTATEEISIDNIVC